MKWILGVIVSLLNELTGPGATDVSTVPEGVPGPTPPYSDAEFDDVFLIRGGSQPTLNGSTKRRRIQRMMKPGDPLRLQRQPNNTFDPNAILIYPASGAYETIDLGYVPRSRAMRLARNLDRGYLCDARIARVNVHGACGQFVHAYVGLKEVSNPASRKRTPKKVLNR